MEESLCRALTVEVNLGELVTRILHYLERIFYQFIFIFHRSLKNVLENIFFLNVRI